MKITIGKDGIVELEDEMNWNDVKIKTHYFKNEVQWNEILISNNNIKIEDEGKNK